MQQIKYSDRQIAKRLLGGTMINDEGSSRSQSEVHERGLHEILALRDRRKIQFAINDQLFPILIANGYNINEDDEFVFDTSEDISMEQQWKIISGLMSHGYNIPDNWLSETFSVPITGRDAPQPGYNPFAQSKKDKEKSFFD